jgi:hypothetical protein
MWPTTGHWARDGDGPTQRYIAGSSSMIVALRGRPTFAEGFPAGPYR